MRAPYSFDGSKLPSFGLAPCSVDRQKILRRDRPISAPADARTRDSQPTRPDRLAVGLSSADPAVAGIWTVPLSAFTGVGTPVRRVALSTRAFPNGVSFAADGTL